MSLQKVGGVPLPLTFLPVKCKRIKASKSWETGTTILLTCSENNAETHNTSVCFSWEVLLDHDLKRNECVELYSKDTCSSHWLSKYWMHSCVAMKQTFSRVIPELWLLNKMEEKLTWQSSISTAAEGSRMQQVDTFHPLPQSYRTYFSLFLKGNCIQIPCNQKFSWDRLIFVGLTLLLDSPPECKHQKNR